MFLSCHMAFSSHLLFQLSDLKTSRTKKWVLCASACRQCRSLICDHDSFSPSLLSRPGLDRFFATDDGILTKCLLCCCQVWAIVAAFVMGLMARVRPHSWTESQGLVGGKDRRGWKDPWGFSRGAILHPFWSYWIWATNAFFHNLVISKFMINNFSISHFRNVFKLLDVSSARV